MQRLVLAAASLLAVCSLSAQSPSLHYVVSDPTPAQHLLLQQHFDVLGNCCGGGTTSGRIDVVLERDRVQLLMAIAPQAQFVATGRPFAEIELEQQIAAGPGVDIDAQYYTVAEIEQAIDAQVALFPALAQKVNLSTLPGGVLTHQGRPIYALKVSDNVASAEDEPALLLAAQHHAREVNSPVMVIGAMQRILAGYATDPQLQSLVNGYELWFVPMVNPDGVNHVWTVDNFWRKNRRNNGANFGVDNNRNYPFLWSLCGSSATTSSETYRGPSAGSEPETMVMRNLVARLRPELYLDFHSYGQDVLRIWAPCANVHPTMHTFQEHYVDAMCAQLGFSKRDPSGSGEAPEDHYASGGTLSYLIEVGTAFQPPWAATVAEEIVVWNGVRHALTTWRPARRGHVRSALGSAPLVSTITFAPNVFNHGEVTKSRASDGRYGLWLPLGTWDVTFAATGHTSRTVSVTVTSYDSPVDLDVLLEPTAPVATTTKVGNGNLGTTTTFTYTSPGDAGKSALFGWSLGNTPGINLGGLRVIPLNHDALFDAALTGNPFLSPTIVVLNAAAQAQSTLLVPNIPWLVGLPMYIGGITVDPTYQASIKTWSQSLFVPVIP